MVRHKKGDISLNMIVVAAIALLVMVIIMLIFTGKISFFREQGEKCVTMGGTCKPEYEGCNAEYETEQPYLCDLNTDGKYTRDTSVDGVCCIKV